MKNEALLIWSSTLVTLQVLTGGAVLGDVIGLKAAGLAILVVAALQAGTSFYIRGTVTPNDTVAAQITPQGETVAGPAAPVVDGAPVAVVPTAAPRRLDERGQIDAMTVLVVAVVVLVVVVVLALFGFLPPSHR